MNRSYPRVLIINSQSIYKRNNTGITMQSLWGGWDSESILEIYIEPVTNDRKNSIRLKDNYIQKVAHWRRNVNKGGEIQKVLLEGSNKASTNVIRLGNIIMNLIPIHLTHDVFERIVAFSPDIIYTLGASPNILMLVKHVAKKMNLPVIIHYMDNWVECIPNMDHAIVRIYHKIMIKNLKSTLKHSKTCFTISEYMGKVYNHKFPWIKHHVFMNAIDVSFIPEENRKTPKSDIINFLYAGNIRSGRWETLSALSEVVQRYNGKLKLVIYTDEKEIEKYRFKFCKDTTILNGVVDHSEMTEIYRKMDVLVHVEPFTSDNIFTKFSISTKIPEYLITGKRILYCGSSDTGVCKYINENKLGYVAIRKDEIDQIVMKIISDISRGINPYWENEIELAKKNHNIKQIHEELLMCIQKAVLRGEGID